MIFYEDDEGNQIYWANAEDGMEGPFLFSFDKKTVFNFWTDYPDKLTDEQIKIFQKANPTMAALKPVEK